MAVEVSGEPRRPRRVGDVVALHALRTLWVPPVDCRCLGVHLWRWAAQLVCCHCELCHAGKQRRTSSPRLVSASVVARSSWPTSVACSWSQAPAAHMNHEKEIPRGEESAVDVPP